MKTEYIGIFNLNGFKKEMTIKEPLNIYKFGFWEHPASEYKFNEDDFNLETTVAKAAVFRYEKIINDITDNLKNERTIKIEYEFVGFD